ncbi:MAG: Tol-Pal system protein TolB, partial [Sphingomonas sp.]
MTFRSPLHPFALSLSKGGSRAVAFVARVSTGSARTVGLASLLLAAPALAQNAPLPQTPAAQDDQGGLVVDVEGGISAPMPIAIPVMPTQAVVDTAAGSTDALGRQLAGGQLRTPSVPEVTAPTYDYWSGTGAQSLVQGFIRANGDGNLTVGCYLYDVAARSELTRQGFVVPPADWRRAAHKCADTIYARLTGEGPYFDSRVVYVSETGPKANRIKRLAIMDQDGANHRFLTNGQSIVLTPRFAPNQQSIVYMSYVGRIPSIYVYD